MESMDELKIRWHGHQLRIATSIAVEPMLSVTQGHNIGHVVEQELRDSFKTPIAVTMNVEPHDQPDAPENNAHGLST